VYIQLQLLGDQLHQRSLSGGVSPVSFLLAYAHSSLPVSPSRSQRAREYPSGPTSTHSWTHLYVPSLSLIFAWLAQEGPSTVSLQTSNSWNLAAAEAVGGARYFDSALSTRISLCRSDSPEVTGTLILPTTSRPGPSPTPTTDGSSNHGRIVGGALGGVLGAAMISGVVAYFVVRHRRARGAPSTTDTRGEGEMGQPVPDPRTIETPRLYVSLYSSFLHPYQQWEESCN
jgi:hypothetical protein